MDVNCLAFEVLFDYCGRQLQRKMPKMTDTELRHLDNCNRCGRVVAVINEALEIIKGMDQDLALLSTDEPLFSSPEEEVECWKSMVEVKRRLQRAGFFGSRPPKTQ